MRAEDPWLRGVVSGDPHVNVLVQCSDMPMASGFDEMTELCARHTLRSACCRAILHLPDTHLGTCMMGDVSTLTLRAAD